MFIKINNEFLDLTDKSVMVGFTPDERAFMLKIFKKNKHAFRISDTLNRPEDKSDEVFWKWFDAVPPYYKPQVKLATKERTRVNLLALKKKRKK